MSRIAMINKIIVLRPALPLRPAQLRTKKVVAQKRAIRDLSRALRNIRKVNPGAGASGAALLTKRGPFLGLRPSAVAHVRARCKSGQLKAGFQGFRYLADSDGFSSSPGALTQKCGNQSEIGRPEAKKKIICAMSKLILLARIRDERTLGTPHC